MLFQKIILLCVLKGPNFWKFNNFLISDTTSIEQMKPFAQKTIAGLVIDNSLSDQERNISGTKYAISLKSFPNLG